MLGIGGTFAINETNISGKYLVLIYYSEQEGYKGRCGVWQIF